MLDDFQSGSIAAAQEEREDASVSWREAQARANEKTSLAIRLIRGGRKVGLDDDAIRRVLAQRGLTWDDCDFH